MKSQLAIFLQGCKIQWIEGKYRFDGRKERKETKHNRRVRERNKNLYLRKYGLYSNSKLELNSKKVELE